MKSPLLRKYKDIYDIISKLKNKKNVTFNTKKNTVKIMTPRRSPIKSSKKDVKKDLNPYQKFIKTESIKSKYKNMSPKSRLKNIAKAWNIKKNK
jgi:hypothetical protein